MSFNILDEVKKLISPDLIAKASSFLGESNSGISKALSGILPVVLSTVTKKASSGSNNADEILNAAKEAHYSGLTGNPEGFFNSNSIQEKGANLVKGLFGDKASSTIDSISDYAGIKKSSAASLLNFATPLAAGAVGKHAIDNKLDTGGFASFLSGQKSSFLSMIPNGLSSIAGMLGLGKISGAISSAYNTTENTVRKTGSAFRWLLPLLLVVAAGLLIWWFLLGGKSGCNKTPSATSDTTAIRIDNGMPDTITKAPVLHESLLVKLPDGTELNAYKGGIEETLVNFLSTEWIKLGEDSLKKMWFDFDNLNFETGSARITAESQAQINNIVAILKAFPNAKLKIGGYTDKTGNENANRKVSTDRAAAVRAAIKAAGQGNQVISAEGYGSQYAKYPADAPETDRVKDRHVSVSVRG